MYKYKYKMKENYDDIFLESDGKSYWSLVLRVKR